MSISVNSVSVRVLPSDASRSRINASLSKWVHTFSSSASRAGHLPLQVHHNEHHLGLVDLLRLLPHVLRMSVHLDPIEDRVGHGGGDELVNSGIIEIPAVLGCRPSNVSARAGRSSFPRRVSLQCFTQLER
jgi:hypothetical protein